MNANNDSSQADTRATRIQDQVQEKMASARWARCLKRLGLAVTALSFAAFKTYGELADKFEGTWFETWFDYLSPADKVKSWALALTVAGAILVVVAYLMSDIRLWWQRRVANLWPKYFLLRKLEPVDLPNADLLDFIFCHGDARNPGSFVRPETLRWLSAINAAYVCAWAEARPGHTKGQAKYDRPCFFVIAPLSRAGRSAMDKRVIKKNKDLLPEHVAKSFGKSCGLYIIEVFGASFFEKGAILYLLQRTLEKNFLRKLSDAQFKIYTRPVNEFGYRQVKRFGFKNLGDTSYEMHSWRAAATPGLCSRAATAGA